MRLRTVGGNVALGHGGQNGCMDSEASDTARAVRRHGGRRLYGASAVRGSAAPARRRCRDAWHQVEMGLRRVGLGAEGGDRQVGPRGRIFLN
jgi:hypothetical protein